MLILDFLSDRHICHSESISFKFLYELKLSCNLCFILHKLTWVNWCRLFFLRLLCLIFSLIPKLLLISSVIMWLTILHIMNHLLLVQHRIHLIELVLHVQILDLIVIFGLLLLELERCLHVTSSWFRSCCCSLTRRFFCFRFNLASLLLFLFLLLEELLLLSLQKGFSYLTDRRRRNENLESISHFIF